jgi:hypothetical protein
MYLTTEALLAELRASATDLAKLIEYCERRRPPAVYLSEAAVTAWEQRAPAAWAAARSWLEGHDIAVRII